jgi:PAS domain S-box-containing protein
MKLKKVKTTEEYIKLLNECPKPAYIFDAETLFILDVNEAACRLYHHTHERFLTLSMLDLRPEAERNKTRAEIILHGKIRVYFGEKIHQTKFGKILKVKIEADKIIFNDKQAWFAQVKVLK